MAPTVISVTVWPYSDGIDNTPSNAVLNRNDTYYRERLAQEWAQELDRTEPGKTFILNRLPKGYSGQEKTRPNEHVDRCKYSRGRY